MGESTNARTKLRFDRRIRLEFRGATITSDAGLLACRELDDALGLTETADECLQESRGGRNVQHQLVGLLRQSVYSRLAGYEDTNDAERLAEFATGQRHLNAGQKIRGWVAFELPTTFKAASVLAEGEILGPRTLIADLINFDALDLYDDNNNGSITCAEASNHKIVPVGKHHPAYEHMDEAEGGYNHDFAMMMGSSASNHHRGAGCFAATEALPTRGLLVYKHPANVRGPSVSSQPRQCTGNI